MLNTGQQCGELYEQRAAGGIAEPQPDHWRTFRLAHTHGDEIFILGEYDGPCFPCALPYKPIASAAQPEVNDMLGFASLILQPAGQCRRKLGIDKEPHLQATRITR